MLPDNWKVIEEPMSPQALKRMSPQEKEWLLLQQHLEVALLNEREDDVVDCLLKLGKLDEAKEYANSFSNNERADKWLIWQGKSSWCACPSIKLLVLNEKTRKDEERFVSSYHKIKELPNNLFRWRCRTCGDNVISREEPPDLTHPTDIKKPDVEALK